MHLMFYILGIFPNYLYINLPISSLRKLYYYRVGQLLRDCTYAHGRIHSNAELYVSQLTPKLLFACHFFAIHIGHSSAL